DRGWIVRWQLERTMSPCKRNSDVPESLISAKGRGTSLFRLHGRPPGNSASCAPCQRLVRIQGMLKPLATIFFTSWSLSADDRQIVTSFAKSRDPLVTVHGLPGLLLINLALP